MIVTLGDIADSIQTGPFGSQLHRSDYTDEGTPVIMPQDIVNWRLSTEKIVYVDDYTVERLSRHKVALNDIIYPRRGDVSKCAIIGKNEENWLCGTGCLKITINPDKANPMYVFYCMQQTKIGQWIEKHATGATMLNINSSTLNSLPLELPELTIQNRIIEILSAYDDMIDNCKQQIALLEEAAQRLYREWFVDLRFPGHETTPIGENGLPKGWTITILDDVADITMGQSPASSFYNNEKIGLPFHQGVSSFGNIYVVNDTYTSKWTKEAPANSILFSVRAPVGRINLTLDKVALGRGVASINHKDKMQPYLYHYLKHFFYKDDVMGNGTIFSSINKDQLKNVNVLNPSKETMKLFCDVVAPYDTQLAVIDGKLRYLMKARDLLLPRLVSGQIEINA